MKKLVYALIISFYILQIGYSQTGWNIISTPVSSPSSIWSLYFLNSLTGYLASNDYTETYSIMKTTNGGYNWITQVSGNDSKSPFAIHFVNESTGFIAGGDPWLMFSPGLIYRTTNAGNNWSVINMPETTVYRAITFTDINTGYIVGSFGYIRKTTDSGLSWMLLQSNTSTSLRSIFFTDMQTGYAVGFNGMIIKTSNGGFTWFMQNSNITETLYSVYFINAMTGFAAGDANQISTLIKTTNAGLDWSTLSLGINFRYLQTVYFIDANTGFVGGTWGSLLGGSAKTTNGGLNWFGQDIPPAGSLTKNIHFFNNLNGIATEFNNVIKTTNSGAGVPNAPSLQGAYIGGYKYRLSWNDNSLAEDGFKVEMKNNIDTNWVIRQVTEANIFSVTDSGFAIGPTYFFRNYAFNSYGNSNYSNVVSFSLVSILPTSSEVPDKFELSQNYPNPFNPVTKIKFNISGSSETQALLSVYDVLGKEVAVLVDQELQPGTYEADWDASAYPSGVYYYKLEGGNFSETKKMILLK